MNNIEGFGHFLVARRMWLNSNFGKVLVYIHQKENSNYYYYIEDLHDVDNFVDKVDKIKIPELIYAIIGKCG